MKCLQPTTAFPSPARASLAAIHVRCHPAGLQLINQHGFRQFFKAPALAAPPPHQQPASLAPCCCSPPSSGCTWALAGPVTSATLATQGTGCSGGAITLTLDTPTRGGSLGATCPFYSPVLEMNPGAAPGLLLAPTTVCQAPFATASGVSLKPDRAITIRSVAIDLAGLAPPFTLRFSAPAAAPPVDVDVPTGSLPASAFDLPGAGFTVPAATPGFTLDLILPSGGPAVELGKLAVVQSVSELPLPPQPPLPPPRQVYWAGSAHRPACRAACTLPQG